ncbi:hypothetical protein PMKS-002886 [Pichia membranifaciens]|uniref:LicD/FKTN/FKRP nucleotidyltransferase domain-containing protein n=1 Tax=Pichia membranifaciens TaxID=4926 RepID=A0A1Q2YIK5_9ASCO|nr:hypothetical protein PMKS-002886 [Pichia membranifaciens]
MPFSWEDWADLSALNSFLGAEDSTCYSFFHSHDIDLDYTFEANESSSTYLTKSHCLDNEEYLKTPAGELKDPALLPGFNFNGQINEKSDFIGQFYNAKSYLLSAAPPPTLIYFLHDNGTYHKVEPYASSSMMRNGMFDSFVSKKSLFQGFDPITELENLSPNRVLKNPNDFKSAMVNAKSFELSIPESRFVLNTEEMFHYLHAKKESSLALNEKRFLESIGFSKATKVEDAPKYFHEVNVKWYAKYNGHEIKENGAHYDFRFFSGFLSEMPSAEATVHSPEYDPAKPVDYALSIDNTINRQTIILSHMVHTLFTLTFHDGLFMFPAHGSLLAWYFTSMSFPYDEDEDVQMPIADLAEFCLRYNDSLIVQNPKYGMGKYYVDCTSTLTHRGKGLGNNNIDARVIDVDSGMYVDITGLSVSNDQLNYENLHKFEGWIPQQAIDSYPLEPKQKRELYSRDEEKKDEEKKEEEKKDEKKDEEKEEKEEPVHKPTDEEILRIHKENKIYNCRNDHFYTLDQLSPARLTLFEGAPTFVVASNRSLIEVLETEYGKRSHENPEWRNWLFVDMLRMWVNTDDIKSGCDELRRATNTTGEKEVSPFECFNRNKTFILSELVKNSVYDVTLQESLAYPDKKRPDFNLLQELYRDNSYTGSHVREMQHYHGKWEWNTPFIDDCADISSEWEGLAGWMLEDHSPPKIAMLDYLLFTEKEDRGLNIELS